MVRAGVVEAGVGADWDELDPVLVDVPAAVRVVRADVVVSPGQELGVVPGLGRVGLRPLVPLAPLVVVVLAGADPEVLGDLPQRAGRDQVEPGQLGPLLAARGRRRADLCPV
jgi:hypothetical protein